MSLADNLTEQQHFLFFSYQKVYISLNIWMKKVCFIFIKKKKTDDLNLWTYQVLRYI